jgi:hypothetical protein
VVSDRAKPLSVLSRLWLARQLLHRTDTVPVHPTSHPNIITLKSSQLQRVITPPLWTRFKKQL